MKNHIDMLIFHTANCAGASQLALIAEVKSPSRISFRVFLRKKRCSRMEVNLRKEYQKIFESFCRFHSLNMSSILPNISKKEVFILMSIKNNGNEDGRANVSDVVMHSHTSSPAASRLFKTLEERGYILRSVDANDRRNICVEMTDSGKAVLSETEEIMDGFWEAVMNQLGSDDLNHLCDYLDKIFDVAKNELNNRKYSDRNDKKNG